MIDWLKNLDPRKAAGWITLVSLLGSTIYFLWSVPVRLESAVEGLGHLEQAIERESTLRAQNDSAANVTHLEIRYELCDVQGIPIRDCVR